MRLLLLLIIFIPACSIETYKEPDSIMPELERNGPGMKFNPTCYSCNFA